MRSRLLTACVAVVATLAVSSRASAEFVTLQFNKSVDPTANVYVNGTLNANTPLGPFYWTDNNNPPNGSFPTPTSTFCIEVAGPLPGQGSSATFGVTSVAAAPTINSTAKASAISELYARYYQNAWSSGSFTGSTDAIAFQLALWELVYDGSNPSNTTSLTDTSASSHFYVKSSDFGASASATVGQAQTWLNSLNGTKSFYTAFPGQELVALYAPVDQAGKDQPWQDQITIRPKGTVPAPAGIVLAGMGFVTLLGGRLRLRRKTVA